MKQPFDETLLLFNLDNSITLGDYLNKLNNRQLKVGTKKVESEFSPEYTEIEVYLNIFHIQSGFQQYELCKLVTRFNKDNLPYRQAILPSFSSRETSPLFVLFEPFLFERDWSVIDRKKHDYIQNDSADTIRIKHRIKPFEMMTVEGSIIAIFNTNLFDTKTII